jgi:predicted RNA-binding Zn ribbon-like protein
MSGKQQEKKTNPYDTKHVRRALDAIIEEGKKDLTKTPESLRDNIDTLVKSLMRAMQTPDTEIRLTYKTTAQATCAWTWLTVAAQKYGVIDTERCSAFDIELKNGSGIMFWTEED